MSGAWAAGSGIIVQHSRETQEGAGEGNYHRSTDLLSERTGSDVLEAQLQLLQPNFESVT